MAVRTMQDTTCYSSKELKHIGEQVEKGKLQLDVYHAVKKLGISKVKPTRRGRRSFQKSQKAIPVLSGNRRTGKSKKIIEQRTPALKRISQTCHLNEEAPLTRVGYWNAQSMMNKPTAVCDFVITEKLDVVAITEAWLRGDSRDSPALAEIQNTLKDYRVVKLPRKGKKGGGLCVILRNRYYVTNTKSHSFESFECLELTVSCSGQKTLSLITIYRPPGTGISTSLFFTEFSRLLESVSLLCSKLIIGGDFNFHFDDPLAPNTRKLRDMLESCGLKQVVSQPTHIRGHTLDLLIVREDDDIVSNVSVLPTMPSDHAAIVFTAALVRPPLTKKEIRFRKLHSIDYTRFSEDVKSCFAKAHDTEDLDLCEKVKLFNNSIEDTLDQHAPVTVRSVHLRPHAPWYDDSLRAQKRKLRAKERQLRKSVPKLTIDKQIMKKATTEYHAALKQAKRSYHQKLINDCNRNDLFRLIHDLTVERPGQTLPSHDSHEELSERLCKFFDDKITQLCNPLYNSEMNPTSFTGSFSVLKNPMSSVTCSLQAFQNVSEEDVLKLIKSKKIKTCPLDPAPAVVFSNCTDAFLPAITDMINHSLDHGVFPKSLKSALITPVLKKHNLDPECLNSYRPISNLPFSGKSH
ncbi:uncharacterized protein [Diadema antillarum]|uniref:uncharacterized protein n=1 Tax=Diadema antillarum TaxID=105358 RepID=UPI003A890E87